MRIDSHSIRFTEWTVCCLGTWFISFAAHAISSSEIQICVKIVSQYEDSDTAHDTWTSSTPTARLYRGGQVQVWKNDVSIYGATPTFLDVGACTPVLQVGSGCHSYDVRTWSKGKIGSVTVSAVNDASNARYQTAYDVALCSGSKYNVVIDPGAEHRFNIAAAALWSIYDNGAGLSNVSFVLRADKTDSNFDATPTPEIEIQTDHWNNKFVIAHEMGHAVAFFANGSGGIVGTDCGFSTGWWQSCYTPTTHGMNSQEFDECAAGEGWAHFFSAAAWNTQSANSDCRFTYWIPGQPQIDCESGTTAGFPIRLHRNTCPVPSSGFDGHGVEFDWLMQFWDIHTNSPTNSIEFMLEWTGMAAPWGQKEAFEFLDATADLAAFDSIDTTWDALKCTNGVADGADCAEY